MKGIDAALVIVSATDHCDDPQDKYNVTRRICKGCGESLALYPFAPDEEIHTVIDCLTVIQKRLDKLAPR